VKDAEVVLLAKVGADFADVHPAVVAVVDHTNGSVALDQRRAGDVGDPVGFGIDQRGRTELPAVPAVG
jgi:uncharacterized protein (DUF2141 family)